MLYTLVVIDMQPFYDSAQDKKTLDNVLNLIAKAKTDNVPILGIKYSDEKNLINACIMHLNALVEREIIDYPKGYFINKYKIGGGHAIKHSGVPLIEEKFVICGVNTCFCVAYTAFGIKKHWPNADVIVDLDACNDDYVKKDKWLDNVQQQGVMAQCNL